MDENITVQAQSKMLWLAGSGAIKKSTAIMIAAALLSVSGTAATEDKKDREFLSLNNGSVVMIDVEANDPWQPDGFSKPLSVSAKFVDQAPVIDGRADDPAWAGIPAVNVPMSWGGVTEATVKVVYTRKEIFLLVSWPDATKDDQYHPWVWDPEQGRYVEGAQVEDALLVSIEGGCDWNPSLLSGTEYDFDGWLWLAARSDPIGQAIDIDGNVRTGSPRDFLVKYESRHMEPVWDVKFYDRRKDILTKPWYELERLYKSTQPKPEVYVSYRADGSPTPEFTKVMAPPLSADVNDNPPPLVTQHSPIKLKGDAGDVAAKGHWADGHWTVEYRRSLATPTRTASDSLLERVSQFSLHIFDQSERLDEASESGRIWLEFKPGPEDIPAIAGTTTP